ncbi:hypothetical protein C5Y96_04605 [Blastopirellula marina]|uniref:Uncharacterized protein n=1 Tax=Blastopirellula marina TaxID=124 RepID=A0A2S8G3W9_9BACT|nr:MULTISPECIES: hypothetical protein [Pirellulaceae]PQO39148.1 hypothetical protein C5Y96_04605 [Blastopirellula marina]RCS55456.1 hypothetical protein DTL36_04615 [Bremerella cremea]
MLQFAIVFVGTTLLLAILSDRLQDVIFVGSSTESPVSAWKSSKLFIIAFSVGFTLLFIMLPQWVAAI